MVHIDNAMMQMVAFMRAGEYPGTILNLLDDTHTTKQLLHILSGKSPEQLRDMAKGIAVYRGTSAEDVALQLGISIPSER